MAALDAASLPSHDVSLPGRTFFQFMGAGGDVVGFGGYELLGDKVLLRSIVVLPDQRGHGHGARIVEGLISHAEKAGARTAYLLTETSADFFEALGFTALDRSVVPAAVLSTTQAALLCPASAHVLRRAIESVGVSIYHNPDCGTSRKVIALIADSGATLEIIEYLKNPPSRGELVSLIDRMGIPVRDVLRQKGTPYSELQLGNPALSDDELIDAMMAHPILINRPIVVTPLGVKLCRPSESVLDILPSPQRGRFAKEDGEAVVGAGGNRRPWPTP
jgi:arsenate reductase (glutaredoxin)